MAIASYSRKTSGVFTVGACLVLLAVVVVFLTGQPGNLGSSVQGNLRSDWTFSVLVRTAIGAVIFFSLERFRPAHKEQLGFSPTVMLDAVYVLVHAPIIAGVLAATSVPLNAWLSNNASFMVLDVTRTWNPILIVILGLAITDFFYCLAHIAKHKVPLFWRFHSLHHSQTRLNMFTANRVHPVDATLDHIMLMVPFFLLFPSVVDSAQKVFWFGTIVAWHIQFQHSNIRTTLGPLKYLLVTPQSHRIHHSATPEHWNTNFSNIFCWDRLFGLQHKDVESYPETGIADPNFPEPENFGPGSLGEAMAAQFMYPFDTDRVKNATQA